MMNRTKNAFSVIGQMLSQTGRELVDVALDKAVMVSTKSTEILTRSALGSTVTVSELQDMRVQIRAAIELLEQSQSMVRRYDLLYRASKGLMRLCRARGIKLPKAHADCLEQAIADVERGLETTTKR